MSFEIGCCTDGRIKGDISFRYLKQFFLVTTKVVSLNPAHGKVYLIQHSKKFFLVTTKVVSLNPIHGKVYPDTTLCDKVCQWLVTGQWFSLGTPVSSTNKTDSLNIAEILLKVALNTITLTLKIEQHTRIYM